MNSGFIWFRKNGGIWNNSSSADPATGIGGIPIPATNLIRYVTAIGDVSTNPFNLGQSDFTYDVPDGFTAGWPASGGGWDSFDPAKSSGDVNLSGGNLTINFSPAAGCAQSVSGFNSGKYYWEFVNNNDTFFTTGVGSGVSDIIDYLHSNTWPDGSGITGGSLSSTPAFSADIWAFGVDTILNAFTIGNEDTMSVAVQLVPVQFGMSGLNVTQPIPVDNNRRVAMRWSRDAGATWSQPIIRSIGDIGKYETNVMWRPLGQARYMVFELDFSGMFLTALAGILVEFEVLGS